MPVSMLDLNVHLDPWNPGSAMFQALVDPFDPRSSLSPDQHIFDTYAAYSLAPAIPDTPIITESPEHLFEQIRCHIIS